MKKIGKYLLITFGVFLVLVTLIIVINPSKDSQNQETTNQSAVQEAAYKVTAQEIMKEYEQNELAADRKYKGQIIEVSGKIGTINSEITGKPYVTLKVGEYDIFSVQCLFGRDEVDLLLNLTKGSSVTLKGRVEGKLGNILVEECQIVK